MTSRFIKCAVVVAAAGAALALGTGSASAATTYKVTAGSAPVGTTVAVTGATQGTSPQITFTDATTGTVLNCVSGTAPGSTKTGTALAGGKIGSINGAGTTWNGCTGPLGLTFQVTGSKTWSINAQYKTSNGVTGNIANVSAVVNGGSSCTFTVTGSVPIAYINKAAGGFIQVKNTTSGLTVKNKIGSCFGAVNNGDKANFSAVYKITATNSAYNPVKIV